MLKEKVFRDFGVDYLIWELNFYKVEVVGIVGLVSDLFYNFVF